MNNVLIIPGCLQDVSEGYKDSLANCGFKVHIYDPKCKLECARFIKEHNIDCIFTTSKFGTKQLPIELINERDIWVVIYTLPCNSENLGYCGRYRYTSVREIELIEQIKNRYLWTQIPKRLHKKYFDLCEDQIHQVDFAGNIFNARPQTYAVSHTIAYVGQFINNTERLHKFFLPMMERMKYLGVQAKTWSDIRIDSPNIINNGILSNKKELPDIYAGALVCPNIHHTDELGVSLNQEYYQINICGGWQISDNDFVNNIIDGWVLRACELSTFIGAIDHPIKNNRHKDPEHRMKQIEIFATNHNYLMRLAQIFSEIDSDLSIMFDDKSKEVAEKHCWEMKDIVEGRNVLGTVSS